MTLPKFTEEEDAQLIALAGTKTHKEIGVEIGRPYRVVRNRIHTLRRSGQVPPAENSPVRDHVAPVNDNQLVERCLALGGFPRRVMLPSGIVVLASHDGKLWRAAA